MVEEWKGIFGYADYYVSNFGNVKSLKFDKERLLKCSLNSDGYPTVRLSNNGVQKTMLVHRIVANTFISNPNNLPQVNHIDGIRYNNNISNLEWCTNRENHLHKINVLGHGFGEGSGVNVILNNKMVEYIKSSKLSMSVLSKELGISIGTVQSVISGRTWKRIGKQIDRNKRNGSNINTAKLTEEKVIEILKSDKSSKDLANIYGVNRNNIDFIRQRKTWKHLTIPEEA